MKLRNFILIMATMSSSILLHAQPGLLKAITSGAKASATSKVLNTAGSTVDKTLDKIFSGSLFKKKHDQNNKADTAKASKQQSVTNEEPPGTTELTISNTDYNSINALTDIIRSNKTVTEIRKSYKDGLGIINLVHTGKTEELLDNVLKNTGGKYEVAALDNNKISLKQKK